MQRRQSLAAATLAALVWICAASPALALNLDVDTFGDVPGRTACTAAANDCSLRGAITRANTDASAGPHIITLPAGTYTLTVQGAGEEVNQTGDLDILNAVVINGVGAGTTVITWDETIPVANRDRVFHVQPSGQLTIRDVSIRQGALSLLTSTYGGGIFAEGPLTVERVSVRLNVAQVGGGISVRANTTIRDSAIHLNRALNGGGINARNAFSTYTAHIQNSTISGNTAQDVSSFVGTGGGLYTDTANPNVVVTFSNATVASNTATTGGGIARISSESVVLSNTIVANNTASTNTNCFGTMASQGYNLVWGGDTCGMTAGNNDLVNTGTPNLGALADYGGPTVTQALMAGSAALDRGNPATPGSGGNACTAADQRGLPRTVDGNGDGTVRCDIGAAEGGRWLAVNSTTDSNATNFRDCNPSATPYNCSLRGAISVANATITGSAAVITLPATGTGNPYRLTIGGTGEDGNVSGDLDVDSDVTIVGGGALTTIVDGNLIDRVFHVLTGAGRTLKLQDLTVQRGNGPTSGVGGGGVYVQNPLSLLRTRIRDNRAGTGGGLYVLSSSASITESTLSENQALTSGAGGGGLYNQGGTTVTLVNTTVANNTGASGGGLWVYGDAVLANVTLSGNQGVNGGGITGNGAMTARNTVIANNTATNSANCSILTQTSQGFNLVFGGGTCGFTQGSDKANQDPRLGPLQLNGGSTETMALRSGSAAIDAGSASTPGSGGTACAATDQRGSPRPVDGDGISGARCDIGAYEAATCTTRPNVALGVAPGAPGRLTVTVTAGSGNIVELKLHALPATNVLVNYNALIDQSGEITIPVNATSKQFTMRRANGTGSGTLPFDVVDGCGTWVTFAGGGPNAWGSGGSELPSGDGSVRTPDAPASSPTPTSTPVPTPGPTPLPAACATATRPRVALRATPGAPGRITVTVTAGTGDIVELRLHALPGTNILVSIGELVDRSGELTVPIRAPTVQFTITRVSGSGAATLPFDVVDGCGASATFAGGGPDAWGVANAP